MALPPPRLVRTGHADNDSSVFLDDGPLTLFSPFGPSASSFSAADQRTSVPADNNRDAAPRPPARSIPRCPPDGVYFCTTDFPPGARAPMHRTLSLDYAVVVSGEIVLALDGGDERTVRTGELIVQQGANHSWENRSGEPCRIAFVMVGSSKIVGSTGEVLEETVMELKSA